MKVKTKCLVWRVHYDVTGFLISKSIEIVALAILIADQVSNQMQCDANVMLSN